MTAQETVGVRELRQNLSVYLDRVKRGETLTVTEHRQIVAILQPVPSDDPIDRLIKDGRAAPPTRKDRPKPLTITMKKPLSRSIDEDRRDRL